MKHSELIKITKRFEYYYINSMQRGPPKTFFEIPHFKRSTAVPEEIKVQPVYEAQNNSINFHIHNI